MPGPQIVKVPYVLKDMTMVTAVCTYGIYQLSSYTCMKFDALTGSFEDVDARWRAGHVKDEED